MGILSKIFGGSGEPSDEAREAPVAECAHGALVPRWDNAEDMGKSERISNYYCEGCGENFTVDDAERIRIRANAGV